MIVQIICFSAILTPRFYLKGGVKLLSSQYKMNLENTLYNFSGIVGKMSKLAKNKFLQYSLALMMTVTPVLASCGGASATSDQTTITDTGNNDDTTPPPANNPPTITSSPVTSVNENSAYSYDVDAIDLDGDNLTYSLTTAPSWLSINSSTGVISGTAPDLSSDTTADVTVQVTDGTDTVSQNYTITISDTGGGVSSENVSVLVKGFDSGAALSNIIFELLNTSYSCTTDSSGSCEIISVLPGNYEAQFRDNGAVYETYKSGTLQVNSTKASEGKLSDLEVRLIPAADRDFVNKILRYNSEIRKWSTKPIWDIYTTEYVSSTTVSQSLIDGVKDAIKNEMSEFYQQTFSDSDINIYDLSRPSGQPTDGHVKVYWDDNITGGWNTSYFSGNEIISAVAKFSTSEGKARFLEELGENLIGSGESNIYPSIFNNYTIYTSLQEKDSMLSEIIYGSYSRPTGNTSPDNNPSGTIFNAGN